MGPRPRDQLINQSVGLFLECHDVALTADNTSTWRAEIISIDRELAGKPGLPPLLAVSAAPEN